MTVSVLDILLIVFSHFFADFVFQSDWMALNKSKRNSALGIHCLVYGMFFLGYGWIFAAFAGASHFIIDWLTSRGMSILWKKEKRYLFFVLVGFDQAVHMTVLVFLKGATP